jgi:Icc-related predicted phosphoesterase
MQYHENLTSRRSFLSSTLVGASSLAFSPKCLQAKGKKLRMLSFIVVTDTHLGYRNKASAAKQWEKVAAEIAKANGDLVIHLGDVVDAGRESQYPIYLAARKTIGKPVYEIPGNHDPSELFAKHIRKEIDTVVDHHWLRFLLVGNAHTDSHDGFLTDKQLSWIDRQCQDAAKKNMFTAICMHVPAHKNRHPDRGWYVKPKHGQTKLYEILQKHKENVLALMHGHFHNGLRGWDDHGPVHEICFPSALYNLDRRLKEQKAPGYNPKEFRPGFTQVTIEAGKMKLTYKPLAATAKVTKECKLPQIVK